MRAPWLVLDTNVLVGDWLLDSPAGRVVREEAMAGRVHIGVPAVVLAEARRNFRRQLRSADRALRAAIRDRQRLSVGASEPPLDGLPATVDADVAADRYVERLRTVISEAGGSVLPLPQVSHEDLLKRALAGKRPFDQEGRTGYRDALIWATMLEQARAAEVGATFVLVSADGDFVNAGGELLADLQEDLASFAASVVGARDLKAIVKTFLAEHTALRVELNERLQRERKFFRAVRAELDKAWIGSWPELDADGDIELDWSDRDIEFVHDVEDDFEVTFASNVSGGKALLEFRAHADVQLNYDIPASEWAEASEQTRSEVDWNEASGRGSYVDVIPATLVIEALHDIGSSELSDVKVVRITEDWSWTADDRPLGTGPDRG